MLCVLQSELSTITAGVGARDARFHHGTRCASLLAWRAEVAELASVSSASAAPNPPAEEVIVAPPEYESHPYVMSAYKKYHLMILGYPSNPWVWITSSG